MREIKKKLSSLLTAGVVAALAFGVAASAPAQAVEQKTPAATGIVLAASPEVRIVGNTWVGQSITAEFRNAEGYTPEYRWYKVDADEQRSFINHRGNAVSLVLDASDVNYRVQVNVIFRKSGSADIGVWSGLSSVVTSTEPQPEPTPVGYAVMRGTTIEGQTIEAFPTAPAGYAVSEYRWYRVDGKGTQAFINHYGNKKVLTLGALEVGKKVKVNVIFTKAGAKNVSAWSTLSATVEAAPYVVMIGNTKVGKKIKTKVGAPKGYKATNYAWYRVTSKGKQQAIKGYGKKKTLKVGKKEAGKKVKVKVTFTKKGGPTLTAWSTLSSKIKK